MPCTKSTKPSRTRFILQLDLAATNAQYATAIEQRVEANVSSARLRAHLVNGYLYGLPKRLKLKETCALSALGKGSTTLTMHGTP
jgi:hypothetical protein